MTTPSKPNVPAEMPPEAPADVLSKRDYLIAELEKAAKDSTGTLQQVLRKMGTMLQSTKPGAPYNPQAMQDVKDAFSRYASDKEAAAKPRPPVLLESVEWMQVYLSSRGFPVPAASSAPAAAAPAAPTASAPAARPGAPAAKGKGGAKDGFESGPVSHARSIGGDAPPAPARQPDQQELESMKDQLKNWQMNPGLGRLKG